MSDQKEEQRESGVASEEGDTPIEETARRTGSNIHTDAKPTAKAESTEGGNQGVEGAPNQGTESR